MFKVLGILAVLSLSATLSFAKLGASLAECKKLYGAELGKPKTNDTSVLHFWKSKTGVILAVFSKDKDVCNHIISYQKTEFTATQVGKFLELNVNGGAIYNKPLTPPATSGVIGVCFLGKKGQEYFLFTNGSVNGCFALEVDTIPAKEVEKFGFGEEQKEPSPTPSPEPEKKDAPVKPKRVRTETLFLRS